MTIAIGNYNFEGPYENTSSLKNQSGVYVVLGRNLSSQSWNIVDIGESAMVKDRIENHDREDCWKKQGYGTLAVAVYYCNEARRMTVEKALRQQYNPPCGER